jgi:hypothetical protein
MEHHTIGDVIAERTLYVRGTPQRIVVRLGRPAPFPEGPDAGYMAPIEIEGIGQPGVRHASGADAFQSIELAFRMIGVELWTWRKAKGIELSLDPDGSPVPNGGFPEP